VSAALVSRARRKSRRSGDEKARASASAGSHAAASSSAMRGSSAAVIANANRKVAIAESGVSNSTSTNCVTIAESWVSR
jgi:hypothetical protein